MSAHASIEGILTSVTERGMPEVMRKSNRFGQIFIKLECPCDRASDLRNLDAVR
jgi:hypothetical protein